MRQPGGGEMRAYSQWLGSTVETLGYTHLGHIVGKIIRTDHLFPDNRQNPEQSRPLSKLN